MGSGHARAAQAIEAALREGAPDIFVEVRDVLTDAGWFYRNAYRRLYLFLARRVPGLLDLLYDRSDSMPPWLRKLLLFVDRLEFRKLLSRVTASPPALVVCTHFLPLEILSGFRQGAVPGLPQLWGIVTDVPAHGIWVVPGVDRYFVPLPRTARELLAKGGPPGEVYSLGLPVHPDFSRPESRKSLRERWRLPERFTVLVMAGGEGVVAMIPVLDSFLGLLCDLTLIVVTGKSQSLYRICRRWAQKHAHPGRIVRVLGFVRTIPEWMALSDVVVTKPGGLTVFEGLAMGKALVLLPPRGGQERENLGEAVKAGAAIAVRRPGETGAAVKALLDSPGRLEEMAEKSRALGNPEAVFCLARMISDRVREAEADRTEFHLAGEGDA